MNGFVLVLISMTGEMIFSGIYPTLELAQKQRDKLGHHGVILKAAENI